MSRTANMQMIIHGSLAPEVRLPDGPALTLTRNFGWVVMFCGAALVTVPVAAAWAASLLLKM